MRSPPPNEKNLHLIFFRFFFWWGWVGIMGLGVGNRNISPSSLSLEIIYSRIVFHFYSKINYYLIYFLNFNVLCRRLIFTIISRVDVIQLGDVYFA